MKRCSAFSNMYVDGFQTSIAVLNLLVRPPAFADVSLWFKSRLTKKGRIYRIYTFLEHISSISGWVNPLNQLMLKVIFPGNVLNHVQGAETTSGRARS